LLVVLVLLAVIARHVNGKRSGGGLLLVHFFPTSLSLSRRTPQALALALFSFSLAHPFRFPIKHLSKDYSLLLKQAFPNPAYHQQLPFVLSFA
jgi:hypothetical protein